MTTAASTGMRPTLGKRGSDLFYEPDTAGANCVASSYTGLYDVYDLGAEIPTSDWEEVTPALE